MTRSAKNYCFTINNYTNEHKQHLADKCQGVGDGNSSCLAKYLVYGEEVGEQGTAHLQGFVSFKSRKTFLQAKAWLPTGTHIEVAKGSPSQNRDYCTKDGAFTEFGQAPPGRGARTDLVAVATAIKDGQTEQQVFEQFPATYIRYQRALDTLIQRYRPTRDLAEPPTVRVYWGKTGTGKTRAVYDEFALADIYKHPGEGWFNGYIGQPVALFDDFDGSVFKLNYLLQLTDRYPMIVPIKGNYVNWVPTTLIFTSNKHPNDWFLGAYQEHRNALIRRISEIREFVLEE